MRSITRKDVLRQLHADLIGKDSYRGFTLTYSWLANQFGHFSLGFVPALLVYSCLKKHYNVPDSAFWAAVIVAGSWLLFESYNFLGPLLLKKTTKSNLVYVPEKQYTFQPAWANIAFDTFTDVSFFCFGAFSASLFLFHSYRVMGILGALTLILIYPVSYWFLTKMYLQIAEYPFQFRLSQWNAATISEKDKKVVLDFIDSKSNGKHLLVFGHKGSGKTSLGVGIATEFSIKHTPCTYATAMKLYCEFFETGEGDDLWMWRNCAVLVIDDINPGEPVTSDLVTPLQFLTFLDTLTHNAANREAIRTKNVIWILGSRARQADTDTWEKMLTGIGVREQDIQSVELGV